MSLKNTGPNPDTNNPLNTQGEVRKCPYSGVKTQIGKVNILLKRLSLPETMNIGDVWKWFQNPKNLAKVRENKSPVWRDDGISDRLAFAALIGCLMPDFTLLVQSEAPDAFRNDDYCGFLNRRLGETLLKAKKSKDSNFSGYIATESSGCDQLLGFIHDAFGVFRMEWNKKIKQMCVKKKDSNIASWALALSLCENVPLVEKDIKHRGIEQITREKKAFGIGYHLSGGLISLITEFLESMLRREVHENKVLTNEEWEAIFPRVPLELMEIMREFTPFTRVASEARGKFLQSHTYDQTHEITHGGGIGYSAEFYAFLEASFLEIDGDLRKTKDPPKDHATMTCPVTRSVIDGKNVITILCEVMIVPIIKEYYFPWRKENIPGA